MHVWERRWIVEEDGSIGYPRTAKRHDQVVTLQDLVTTLLSQGSYEALFEARPERVWPGSARFGQHPDPQGRVQGREHDKRWESRDAWLAAEGSPVSTGRGRYGMNGRHNSTKSSKLKPR